MWLSLSCSPFLSPFSVAVWSCWVFLLSSLPPITLWFVFLACPPHSLSPKATEASALHCLPSCCPCCWRAFSSVHSFCTFKIHLLRSCAWCRGYPPCSCTAFAQRGPWFLISRAVSSIRFSLHSGCWKKRQTLDEKYGAHTSDCLPCCLFAHNWASWSWVCLCNLSFLFQCWNVLSPEWLLDRPGTSQHSPLRVWNLCPRPEDLRCRRDCHPRVSRHQLS